MTDVSFTFNLNPDQDDCDQTVRAFEDNRFRTESTSLAPMAEKIGENEFKFKVVDPTKPQEITFYM